MGEQSFNLLHVSSVVRLVYGDRKNIQNIQTLFRQEYAVIVIKDFQPVWLWDYNISNVTDSG